MFEDEFSAAAGSAKIKAAWLYRNPLGYFTASVLAGIYVGFAVLLAFSIGGQLAAPPYVKIVMGASFGVALSLVIMAGAELFTGNNFVMTVGMLKKTVYPGQAIKLWVICYLGNWVGSVLLAAVFCGTGLSNGPVAEFIASSAAIKMGLAPVQLFLRGLLCNILVCLATWCSYRCKSESGKLIMIFWCLFTFITSGYEHSIANMTLFTAALLNPSGMEVSLSGYLYNLSLVTLGNMTGGILCLALPYHLITSSGRKNN